jgi:ketosteroid isomerase-like protein
MYTLDNTGKYPAKGLLIMKRMLLSLVLLMTITSFTQSQGSSKHRVKSKPKIEEQLKAMYERLLAAIKEGDIKVYNQLLTDNYIFTSGGTGLVLTKGERAKEVLARRREQIEEVSVQSYRVYMYGNSAVASFLIHNRGKSQGEDYDSMVNVTVVYVRIGQRWKIAATHSSLVPTNQ